MNLLIDTNVFSVLFESKHAEFANFAVANRCLFLCKGKMYIGGTTFGNEINSERNKEGKPNHLIKYRKYLSELRKANRLIALDKKTVDKEEARIRAIEPNPDFDDPHVIACAILGKVQIICTNDKRSDKFVLDKKFYPKGFRRPKIYRDKRNVHLFNPCFP